jgi:hypothetical protein
VKPEIAIETWTPTLAKRELEEQEKRIAAGDYRNRKVNSLTVNRYANDMRQGHWMVTNQGIGFDAVGNLLDGRHRLWAVVKAGVPVDMLTFRGLEALKNGGGMTINPQDAIDNGRVRSIGQQFGIDGISNAQVTASIIRAISLCSCYPKTTKIGTLPARAILNHYKEEIGKFVVLLANSRKGVRSAFMAPLIMFSKIKPRKADKFFRDFTTLVGLKDGSPVIALDAYARAHAGHAGTDELKLALGATSLALYHFDNDTSVNTIRHSTIGIDWLQKECKEDVARVLKSIGHESE